MNIKRTILGLGLILAILPGQALADAEDAEALLAVTTQVAPPVGGYLIAWSSRPDSPYAKPVRTVEYSIEFNPDSIYEWAALSREDKSNYLVNLTDTAASALPGGRYEASVYLHASGDYGPLYDVDRLTPNGVHHINIKAA